MSRVALLRHVVPALLAVAFVMSVAAAPAVARGPERPSVPPPAAAPSVAATSTGTGTPRTAPSPLPTREEDGTVGTAASWAWIDGGWGWHYEPDCLGGIGFHNSYVGYYGATDGSGPLVNNVYYMHIGFSVGGACAGGVAASLWAWLPPGTTVAPSQQFPVRCLWDKNDGTGWKDIAGTSYSDCKLNPQRDGSGKYYFGTPTIPSFTLYEVWFPVISTQKLIGSAGPNGGHRIQGEVYIGTANPGTTYPKGWTWVSDGTPNTPQVSVGYPEQPVTDLTCTGAKTTGIVYNQFTSGSAYIDLGRDGHGFEASTNAIAIGNTHAAHSVFASWNLAPETTYRWRVRYVSGGQTYTGADRTFRSNDCNAPTGTVSINGGAASTTSPNVTLSLAATDRTGVTQMRLGADGVTFGAWETYATTRAWTFTSDAGTKTVYAQFRDAAGNVSATAQDSISLVTTPPDTTAPTGTVTINGGATSTTSPNVTLSLAATDAVGVTQMRFGADGVTFGAWETYATSRAWTFTSVAGTKMVYAQFRDAAGNVSATAQDSISYAPPATDTTPPVAAAPVAAVVSPSVLGTTTVPVRVDWPAATDASGIARYELQQSTNGGAFAAVALSTATARSKVVNLAPGTTTYQFRVRAFDPAGNPSAWALGPSVGVTRTQENATALVYSGTWTRAALTGASGGYVKYASASTAKVVTTVTGRGVAVVMTKGANRGKVGVYVDGVLARTVDLYSSTTRARQIVFATTFTGSGAHTLELRVTGTKNAASTGKRVDVDAILVTR